MIERIVVYCPAYIHSGGPELLHQLCYILRKSGLEAVMYYDEYIPEKSNPVAEPYRQYKNPYITQYEDCVTDAVIIPETKAMYLKTIFKAR